MSEIIKFFSLGGLDENGKNMSCLQINDDIFIFDCGLKYPDKNYPGIQYIVANIDYLKENASKVKAYIISHAHDDQAGAVPFLYRKLRAPIYCSKVTGALIENKANIYGLKNCKFDFHFVEDNSEVTIANRKFKFISMTHSVPGSLSTVVDTEQGLIFYASDFIIDYGAYSEFKTDFNALMSLPSIKPVLLLINDSHSADKIGNCAPHHRLAPHISRILQDQVGRVFISLYTQNIYNYRELIELCVKYNKKIVLLNDGFTKCFGNSLDEYGCSIPHNNLVSLSDINRYAEKDLVFVIDGEGKEVFEYLIALANNQFNAHISIRESDTVIMASPSVGATENIAVETLDDIYKTGAKIKVLSRKEIYSMHAHEEDIKMLISILRPKYYLPIKGDFRSLMANAKIALTLNMGYTHQNIFVLDNGMVLQIENGKVTIDFKNLIRTGDVLVDDVSVGTVVDEIIDERNRLSNDGIIILGAGVSERTKEIVTTIDCQMRGFVYLKTSENILKSVTKIFEEGLHTYLHNVNKSHEMVIDDIKNVITRYTKKETGKTPIVVINVFNIEN